MVVGYDHGGRWLDMIWSEPFEYASKKVAAFYLLTLYCVPDGGLNSQSSRSRRRTQKALSVHCLGAIDISALLLPP